MPDFHYAIAILSVSLIVALLRCQKYKSLSEKDQFTGTFHRRWFDLNLVKFMKEAKAEDKPLGVVFLDLDNFKEINDSKGHAYGDHVLLAVVKAIRSAMGKTGKLARYGGDEFCVLLPNTTNNNFSITLSQIKESIRNTGLITASVGGTIFYPSESLNFSNLVNRADKGVHAAKGEGGNVLL